MPRTQVRLDTGFQAQELGADGPCLVIVHSPDAELAGSVARLEAPELVIGRLGPGFWVTERDDAVSRRHCVVGVGDEEVTVCDADSTNGTFVDGQRLIPHRSVPLRDGQVLRAGDTLLVFRTTRNIAEAWDAPHCPGRSPAIVELRQRLQELAPIAWPILIQGETGTGKGYASRAIHDLSPQSEGPFIAVNCGALDRSLARAELFGAIKGAYTGATDSRRGLVLGAQGGTLFLDEIGELDTSVQKVLLDYLDHGTFRAVGSSTIQRSSARVVAATNVELEEAVEAGFFRRDLHNRLRAAKPVVLPPVRDRREDIVDWIRYFAESVQRDSGIEVPSQYEAGFVEAMLLHPWPGNLRELLAIVRTVMLDAKGAECVTSRHLPADVVQARLQARMLEPAQASAPRAAPPPSLDPRDQEDWIALHEALVDCRGNVIAVAQQLNRNRRWIYRRMERYGMDPSTYRS